MNLPTAYLPEQFHGALHDIDRINSRLPSQSRTSHSAHSSEALLTQSGNKVKRVGNSVVYPRMLRKIKSDEQVLFAYLRQESRSRSGPRDKTQLRKINSESVPEDEANNAMWIMQVREEVRRNQRAQRIFNQRQADPGRKTHKNRTSPDCPASPKKALLRRLKWLIPSAPVPNLSRLDRETDLLAFNFIPSASKFTYPQNFEELMGNESSAKVVLTVLLSSLQDSLQTYRPLFRNSTQIPEIEKRVDHLCDFFFDQNDLLEKLFQNVCFSLHFFCFLSPADSLRARNSGLLSIRILVLLLGHLARGRSPALARHVRELSVKYWHEFQNSLFKTLKIEASTESGLSLNAFDLERSFGMYSGLGVRLLLSILELVNFDSRLVAEFHESLLNSLFSRFLSAKLAHLHLNPLSRLLRRLFLVCSDQFLVLTGFKLEFFGRFRDSILQIKRDLFEEIDDSPKKKNKSAQVANRTKAQRNVLDAEGLFMWVLDALMGRVENRSQVHTKAESPREHMSGLVAEDRTRNNEFLIRNMRLDESQELGPQSVCHSVALIRSSQNFRILRDFRSIRPRFGTKMKVFVMDNVHRGGRVGGPKKGAPGKIRGGNDNSVKFKKKKLFHGLLSQKEELLQQIKKKKVITGRLGKLALEPQGPGRKAKGSGKRKPRSRRVRKQVAFREIMADSARSKMNIKRSRSLKPQKVEDNESRLLRMLKQKRSQIYECAIVNKRV